MKRPPATLISDLTATFAALALAAYGVVFLRERRQPALSPAAPAARSTRPGPQQGLAVFCWQDRVLARRKVPPGGRGSRA
jgi:hypothetical protein